MKKKGKKSAILVTFCTINCSILNTFVHYDGLANFFPTMNNNSPIPHILTHTHAYTFSYKQ